MSTAISAAIFLPLAPVAMVIVYWQGRRAKHRTEQEQLVTEVEVYLKVRNR